MGITIEQSTFFMQTFASSNLHNNLRIIPRLRLVWMQHDPYHTASVWLEYRFFARSCKSPD